MGATTSNTNNTRRGVLVGGMSAAALATASAFPTSLAAQSSDRKAVSDVKEWNQRAKDLSESAKDLAEIAEAGKAMEGLGATAGALGVFSVGLDIALSFMPQGPSDTELILGAIAKLSNEVDSLWVSLDGQMRQAKHKADWDLARAQIQPVFADGKELNSLLASMQSAADNRDRFRGQELAGQLHKNYDLVALEKMMTQLADQASGTTTAQSILAASYILKFRDLYELKNISLQIIQTFKTALIAVAIWHQRE